MLHIAPISLGKVSATLRVSGGFCWWYLDLVDRQGNGFVLIWSYGLPFLPVKKVQLLPLDRPSVSVACYRAGKQQFYALQEYESEQVQMAGAGQWRFGNTQIRFTETAGEGHLCVELDLSVPGMSSRCTGLVEVSGTLCKTSCEATEAHAMPHLWCPKMVATTGRAALRCGDDELLIDGRAYFDGNASDTPLTQLGIERWRWGRMAFPDRELIYYLVDPVEPAASPENVVVEVRSDGHMTVHPLQLLAVDDERRSLYGPRYHRWIHLRAADLDLTVRMKNLVEPGPFYLRFLTEATCHKTGQVAAGTSELLLPSRVGVRWQQPFVRMRCEAIGRPNSMWLPLFNGPRSSRASRLIRRWLGGGRKGVVHNASKTSQESRLEAR